MSKEQQWRVEPMKIHGWAIHDAAGNMIVKDIYEEEIARFIVRAVNTYGDVVAALREARRVIKELRRSVIDDMRAEEIIDNAVGKINSVLAEKES